MDAGIISCNLGYSYNTSCSHVRNSRAFSPHCASSPPSLICLLHFIIHLNGGMKYLLFRLRESISFVRNRLLKSCIKSDVNQIFVTHRNSGILAWTVVNIKTRFSELTDSELTSPNTQIQYTNKKMESSRHFYVQTQIVEEWILKAPVRIRKLSEISSTLPSLNAAPIAFYLLGLIKTRKIHQKFYLYIIG